MRTNDISGYTTDPKITTADEIVELACALASINRLHEVGEIAFSSDKLFETGDLSIIRQVLETVSETPEENEHHLKRLYIKLKQLKG